MIVVAIIAILAVIVVPQFTKETRKSKAMSEVGAMFGELAIREDQYKTENSVYLEAAACPTSPGRAAQDASSCIAAATPWEALRVRLPTTKLYCSYQVVTNTTASPPALPAGITFTAPAVSWYYILATCDQDGDKLESTYFTSTVDSKIQKLNDGE